MNDMIVYVEKLMKSTKKLQECHFIKVVVYKFNIKKQLLFLHTSSKKIWNMKLKTMPFTIA